MNKRDSVNLVGSDYTQICHSDFFGSRFLNQRKDVHLLHVSRVLFADLVKPKEVYEVNQLKMAR